MIKNHRHFSIVFINLKWWRRELNPAIREIKEIPKITWINKKITFDYEGESLKCQIDFGSWIITHHSLAPVFLPLDLIAMYKHHPIC
jgi:hypothetical protein